MPVSSRGPPQVIDTVPMDETTEEMFRYFEPLYEVIHDMPRPPESFFKRKGGEWGPLRPGCAGASLPSVLPPGTALPLSPACGCPGTAPAPGPAAAPRGPRHGHTASPRPCRGAAAAAEGLFGHAGVPLCDTFWAFSSENFEARI